GRIRARQDRRRGCRDRTHRPHCEGRRHHRAGQSAAARRAMTTPIPLSQLTTLRTGAAPERMLDATTTASLIEALREVWARHEEWFVLGGGSNLFVGDEPFEGTVIRVLTTGIELIPSPHPGRMRVRVQAGHN